MTMACLFPVLMKFGAFFLFDAPIGEYTLMYGGADGDSFFQIECKSEPESSDSNYSWVSELREGEWSMAYHKFEGRHCTANSYPPVNFYVYVCDTKESE